MLSLILNALFSGLVTFVQVLQIGVVSFKDINGIIIWSKWERLLTLHFRKILGNISTKVKRSRFNKSDTVMALSSPGMLRQLRWKVLVYSSISKKTFQNGKNIWKYCKTSLLEWNIKLLLFFHLLKIMCFRELMIRLSNETENPFFYLLFGCYFHNMYIFR